MVPITEDDLVLNKRNLSQELRNALMEVKKSMEGKKKLMTWEELMNCTIDFTTEFSKGD